MRTPYGGAGPKPAPLREPLRSPDTIRLQNLTQFMTALRRYYGPPQRSNPQT